MDLDRCDPDGVDFRALDYISTYDAHLMCPICRCPFVRPVRLQCDHIFCRTCLDSAITCSSSRDDFTCPTCRSPTSDTSVNVPRMLINMCDDIRVKCPFSREGCSEIIPRGHVQLHVDKYCAYRLVDCPDEGCDKKTTKMHLHPEGKCMHELRHCPHCEEDVMEQDFEDHAKDLCPSLETTCPDCQTTVFRKAFDEHIASCPEAVHPCAAAKYGCAVKVKRADLGPHQQTCPLVTMGPYLEAQNSRLDSLELTVRHLRQRNEIFEDGFANIRSTLADPSYSSLLSSPSSRNRQSHTDDPQDRADTPTSTSNSNSTQTTYLLALHESLRDEVAQLSHAITDLDARASMAIMNECLRIKEDMAHTNAAMNSVRMQVQWLMNPRLHGRAVRTDTSTAAANGSGPSTSASASTAALPGSLRPRRVSDSGREGTKL